MDDVALEKKGLRMARFFLPKENLRQQKATISGQELEHLRRVLRLRPGDRVTLFDDQGWEHEGVIQSFSRDQAQVEILRSYRAERESCLDLILAQALGKGDKMDLIVEKATELGVKRIVPFLSSYTVPRPDQHQMERRRGRWSKIALSAAKQSGRTQIPEILGLRDFEALLREPWHCELKLLLWENEPSGGLPPIREENPGLNRFCLSLDPKEGLAPRK